jgi:hypothetical protein
MALLTMAWADERPLATGEPPSRTWLVSSLLCKSLVVSVGIASAPSAIRVPADKMIARPLSPEPKPEPFTGNSFTERYSAVAECRRDTVGGVHQPVTGQSKLQSRFSPGDSLQLRVSPYLRHN